MINISVSGQTYPMRSRFAGMGYHWNGVTKTWEKIVGEASLNYQIEQLRPIISLSDEPSPMILLTLTLVDVNGKQLSDQLMKIKLRSISLKSDSERVGTNFLELFQHEVCDVKLSPRPFSPTPPKSEEKKKRPGVDPGFF